MTCRYDSSSSEHSLELSSGRGLALRRFKGELILSGNAGRILLLTFAPAVILMDPKEAIRLTDLYIRFPYLDPSQAWLKPQDEAENTQLAQVLSIRNSCDGGGFTSPVAVHPEVCHSQRPAPTEETLWSLRHLRQKSAGSDSEVDELYASLKVGDAIYHLVQDKEGLEKDLC